MSYWEEEFLDVDDDHLDFVHGTTSDSFSLHEQVLPIGRGEFGIGFYTFCFSGRFGNWGKESALQWAQVKADESLLRPRLVYLRIRRVDYDQLTRKDVDASNLYNISRELHNREAGKGLVRGPIGTDDEYGRRVPRFDLPLQYKFESSALSFLIIQRIEDF
jgi:hypothetical protein